MSSLVLLVIFNALGLLMLTGLFLGYIRMQVKYEPPNQGKGSGKDNDDNDGGGGGFDPGLPKIDLPPGSGLADWQTDRITSPKIMVPR